MDNSTHLGSHKDRFAIRHDILYNELEVLLLETQRQYIKVPFASDSHTSIEIRFPQHEFAFLIRVLPEYPDAAPVFLGIDTLLLSTSYDKLDAVKTFQQCLQDVFKPGSMCFSTLIQTLEERYKRDADSDEATSYKSKQRSVSTHDVDNLETYADDLLKSVTCAICLDTLNKFDGAVLPCDHTYCCQCLQDSIEPMLAGRSVIRCCGRILPFDVIKDYCILPQKTLNAYEELWEEFSTPRPIYCSRTACSKFVAPRYTENDTATCSRCKQRTCTVCRKPKSKTCCSYVKKVFCSGPACNELVATQSSKKEIMTCRKCKQKTCVFCGKKSSGTCCTVDIEYELRRKGGWKRCPRCEHVIARETGCSLMTCICGQRFCYDCGGIRDSMLEGSKHKKVLLCRCSWVHG